MEKSYTYRYILTCLVDPEIVWVPKYFLLVDFSAAIVNAGAKQEKTNATIKTTINFLYIFDILPLLLCYIKLVLSCFLSKSCWRQHKSNLYIVTRREHDVYTFSIYAIPSPEKTWPLSPVYQTSSTASFLGNSYWQTICGPWWSFHQTLARNSETWSFLYLLRFTVVQLLENRLEIGSPSIQHSLQKTDPH